MVRKLSQEEELRVENLSQLKNMRETLKDYEIQKLINSNNYVYNNEFTLKYKYDDKNKFAILIGKKLGNAVFRNRQRRLVREVLFNTDFVVPDGMTFLLIGRNNLNRKKYKQSDIKRSIEDIFLKVKEK